MPMPEQHTILSGKVCIYKRPNRSLWQRSTYLAGKNRRVSTKEVGRPYLMSRQLGKEQGFGAAG
jgi:hypothetical protein